MIFLEWSKYIHAKIVEKKKFWNGPECKNSGMVNYIKKKVLNCPELKKCWLVNFFEIPQLQMEFPACKGQWLIFKFLSGMCWAVESWWSYLIISNIVFWFFPYLLSKTLLRPKVKSKNMLLDLFDSWDSTEKSSWTFGIYAKLNRFWRAGSPIRHVGINQRALPLWLKCNRSCHFWRSG